MLAFVAPWMSHSKTGIEFARETYHSGYRTGDSLYGSYGAFLFGMQTFVAGMNLAEYESQLSDYTDSLKRMGQVFTPSFWRFNSSPPEISGRLWPIRID